MSSYEKIYHVVKQIPCGQVATYGQVAELAGLPRQARLVGYAMSALKDQDIPWHRVINSKGEISKRANPDFEDFQKTLLEEEGIEFTSGNRLSLQRYQWKA